MFHGNKYIGVLEKLKVIRADTNNIKCTNQILWSQLKKKQHTLGAQMDWHLIGG